MARIDAEEGFVPLKDWLTGDGGTSINYGRLATYVVGIISGSFFGGWGAAVIGFYNAWFIEPLNGLANWLNFRITVLAEGLASIGEVSWGQSIAFAGGLGLLAPVFAFALYLALARVIAYLRKEVSE